VGLIAATQARSHEVISTTMRVAGGSQCATVLDSSSAHYQLRAEPTRYRTVVLTSWDRGMSDSVPFLHTTATEVRGSLSLHKTLQGHCTLTDSTPVAAPKPTAIRASFPDK